MGQRCLRHRPSPYRVRFCFQYRRLHTDLVSLLMCVDPDRLQREGHKARFWISTNRISILEACKESRAIVLKYYTELKIHCHDGCSSCKDQENNKHRIVANLDTDLLVCDYLNATTRIGNDTYHTNVGKHFPGIYQFKHIAVMITADMFFIPISKMFNHMKAMSTTLKTFSCILQYAELIPNNITSPKAFTLINVSGPFNSYIRSYVGPLPNHPRNVAASSEYRSRLHHYCFRVAIRGHCRRNPTDKVKLRSCVLARKLGGSNGYAFRWFPGTKATAGGNGYELETLIIPETELTVEEGDVVADLKAPVGSGGGNTKA